MWFNILRCKESMMHVPYRQGSVRDWAPSQQHEQGRWFLLEASDSYSESVLFEGWSINICFICPFFCSCSEKVPSCSLFSLGLNRTLLPLQHSRPLNGYSNCFPPPFLHKPTFLLAPLTSALKMRQHVSQNVGDLCDYTIPQQRKPQYKL